MAQANSGQRRSPKLAVVVTGSVLVGGMLLGSGTHVMGDTPQVKNTAPPPSASQLLQQAMAPSAAAMAPLGAATHAPARSLSQAQGQLPSRGEPRPQILSVRYTVKEGDTLEAIAQVYNTWPGSIMSANSGIVDTELQIGQVLDVPTFKGVLYTVKDGDTVETIAAQYKIAPGDVLKANGLVTEVVIQPGQKLALPGAQYQAPEAVIAAAITSNNSAPAAAGAASSTHAESSYIWPAEGAITSTFGPRWGGFHTGVDIGAPTGTTVVAAKSGRVVEAGWDGGYGKCVILEHSDGTRTRYAHASVILVNDGDTVKQGDPVIKVGSTGHSTGPHLHFEVIVDGQPRNPLNYLP